MPRPRKDPKPAVVPVAAAPQPVPLVPQQAPAPAPVSLLPQGLPADNNAAPLVVNRAEYVRVRDSVSPWTSVGAFLCSYQPVPHGFGFVHAPDTPGMPSHAYARTHKRPLSHNTSKPCPARPGVPVPCPGIFVYCTTFIVQRVTSDPWSPRWASKYFPACSGSRIPSPLSRTCIILWVGPRGYLLSPKPQWAGGPHEIA